MSAADLTGRHLHLDCFSGIAGDMTLSALVDLGVPEAVIGEALAACGLGDVTLRFGRVTRSSLVGLHLVAERGSERITPTALPESEHAHDDPQAHGAGEAPGHDHAHDHTHDHAHDHDPHGAHQEHAHRGYASIRALLERSLDGQTRALALAIFGKLAEVEAAQHGCALDEVVFHEVGALDSILDIVGVAAALAWLRPSRVTVRTIPTGHGMVRTAHGRLPVPAPATLALLRGFPIEDGGVAMELTTPTGAAIVAAVATPAPGLPSGTVRAIGCGAGTCDLPGRPNLLRVVLVDPPAAGADAAQLVQLEANLDDLSPQLLAPLVEALLAAGARDAWLCPIVMKKGRPGFLIGALVEEARRSAVEQALFANSTTLGVRRWTIGRSELHRRWESLSTPYGEVRVKLGERDGVVSHAALEYEDVARLAVAHGMTVKELYYQLDGLLLRWRSRQG